MARTKKEKLTLSGGQLLSAGDVIRVMEQDNPVKCKVLSCLATPEGGCYASLEILEGDRRGQRFRTHLKAGGTE